MTQTFITGIGHYLPPRVVSNDDLPASLNTNDAWIRKRTGIETRHWVDAGVYTSDLGTEAARAALQDAQLEAKDLDCIIAATLSPDHAFPGIGVYIQRKLGINFVPAFDIRNQCSGFLYSLQIARSFILSGQYRKVLVVGAELHSHALGMTEQHRHISVLFGDGAGAVVVTAEPRPKGISLSIDDVKVFADGTGAECLRQRVWDTSMPHFVRGWEEKGVDLEIALHAEMDGQEVLRRAVMGMAGAANESVNRLGLKLDDIAYFIPHQANLNINKTVATVLQVPQERFLNNIQKIGNTTAASIPILLYEALRDGKVKSGNRLMALAFGSGFTWGSAVLTAQ